MILRPTVDGAPACKQSFLCLLLWQWLSHVQVFNPNSHLCSDSEYRVLFPCLTLVFIPSFLLRKSLVSIALSRDFLCRRWSRRWPFAMCHPWRVYYSCPCSHVALVAIKTVSVAAGHRVRLSVLLCSFSSICIVSICDRVKCHLVISGTMFVFMWQVLGDTIGKFVELSYLTSQGSSRSKEW